MDVAANDRSERRTGSPVAKKQRSRGLSDVRERMLERFQYSGELHEFFILDCSDCWFLAYAFYPQTKDIKEAETSGLEARIKDAVFGELENVGRGDRKSVEVEFELDSHENIEQQFEGSLRRRLRRQCIGWIFPFRFFQAV